MLAVQSASRPRGFHYPRTYRTSQLRTPIYPPRSVISNRHPPSPGLTTSAIDRPPSPTRPEGSAIIRHPPRFSRRGIDDRFSCQLLFARRDPIRLGTQPTFDLETSETSRRPTRPSTFSIPNVRHSLFAHGATRPQRDTPRGPRVGRSCSRCDTPYPGRLQRARLRSRDIEFFSTPRHLEPRKIESHLRPETSRNPLRASHPTGRDVAERSHPGRDPAPSQLYRSPIPPLSDHTRFMELRPTLFVCCTLFTPRLPSGRLELREKCARGWG
jgi:hypothetical protein